MDLLGFKLTGVVRSFSESCPGLVVPGRRAQAARQSVSREHQGSSSRESVLEHSGQSRAVWALGRCGCPSSGCHKVGVGPASSTGWDFFPLAETSCAATEFRCRDGTCIGNSSRCNQFIDCQDASDEMNCSECPAAALPQLWRSSCPQCWQQGSGSSGFGLDWGGRRVLLLSCSRSPPLCRAPHHPMDPCSSGHVWGMYGAHLGHIWSSCPTCGLTALLGSVSWGSPELQQWGVMGSGSRAGAGATWWNQNFFHGSCCVTGAPSVIPLSCHRLQQLLQAGGEGHHVPEV